MPTYPDISFANTDPAQIEADLIAAYETAFGRVLYPGDPVRILLSTVAAGLIQQRNLLDDAARMNLLRYSAGDYLNELGRDAGLERLAASAALTTVRFTLSMAQPGVITIPAGTRIASGATIFATLENADIAAGLTTIDVPVQATVAGSAGNGYLIGQVNQLVDPLSWVASVSNTTISQGGTDAEDDDTYRARIQLAPTALSVAGPVDAYALWAKSAAASIADVSVTSPNPCEVIITPLLEDGGIPGAELLAAVLAAVTDKYRRPLTDLVTVAAPNVANYSIDLTYWIDQADAAEETTIKATVEAAVAAYQLWQRIILGRDINPSKLNQMLMNARARRSEIRAPIYTALPATSVAHVSNTPVGGGTAAQEFGQLMEGAGRANYNWLTDNSTMAGVAFTAEKTGLLTSMATAWHYTAPGYGGGAGHAGTYEVKLVAADSNNLPSSTVLATVANWSPETNMASDDAPAVVTFGSPVMLLAGALYFLTFRNVSSSPSTNWGSPNIQMTRVIPWADWVADGFGARLLARDGSGWYPWCSIHNPWGDGGNTGNGSYMPALCTWQDGTKTGSTYWSEAMGDPALIYGTHYAGERITWAGASIELSKIGVSLRRIGTPGTLSYHLEEVGGDELATGAVTLTSDINDTTSEWMYATLDTPVTLTSGSTYRLWFAASGGDGSNNFVINAPYGLTGNADWLAHMWRGASAYAEIDTTGSWVAYSPDADLPISLQTAAIPPPSGSTVNIVYGGLEVG